MDRLPLTDKRLQPVKQTLFSRKTHTKSMLKFVYSLTHKSVMEANLNRLSVSLKLNAHTMKHQWSTGGNVHCTTVFSWKTLCMDVCVYPGHKDQRILTLAVIGWQLASSKPELRYRKCGYLSDGSTGNMKTNKSTNVHCCFGECVRRTNRSGLVNQTEVWRHDF